MKYLTLMNQLNIYHRKQDLIPLPQLCAKLFCPYQTKALNPWSLFSQWDSKQVPSSI